MAKISAQAFYAEYHGHTVAHLSQLVPSLRQSGTKSFVYMAGDSTLDNKHWLFKKGDQVQQQPSCSKAINGYENVLDPPVMMRDVSYWLNEECLRWSPNSRVTCINGAVEESCVSQRENEGLLPQDEFIRDNITEDDVLVVDVGGNDVALRPTKWIIFHMMWLLYLTPTCFIRCGPYLAPGLWYFIHMFRIRLQRLVKKLVAKRKPKKIVICMLYYLDESPGGSWADGTLRALGYDTNPAKLQAVMRQVYSWGVSQVSIPGTEVVTVPLYEVLDGKNTEDYVARVEPSDSGGQKLAAAVAKAIFDSDNE